MWQLLAMIKAKLVKKAKKQKQKNKKVNAEPQKKQHKLHWRLLKRPPAIKKPFTRTETISPMSSPLPSHAPPSQVRQVPFAVVVGGGVAVPTPVPVPYFLALWFAWQTDVMSVMFVTLSARLCAFCPSVCPFVCLSTVRSSVCPSTLPLVRSPLERAFHAHCAVAQRSPIKAADSHAWSSCHRWRFEKLLWRHV